jgi:hypothetical protein
MLQNISQGPGFKLFIQSRDISIGIGTGYGMIGWGSISGRGRRLFLFNIFQSDPGPHPASNSMYIGGKAPGT